MINEFFVLAGIILMICSVAICLNILLTVREKMAWMGIFILIVFFLAAYITYFIVNLNKINTIWGGEILTSQILFWGSNFVTMILLINLKINKKLSRQVAELTLLTEKLEHKREILRNVQEKLKEKNKKLEELMDEFYTFRLSMETGKDKDKVAKENLKIKENIDKVI